MTAHEHQPEPFLGRGLRRELVPTAAAGLIKLAHRRRLLEVAARLAAPMIQRLVPRSADQPGSRVGRGVAEQVTITARARWARLLAPWAATTIWAMATYLGCVSVLYGVTAHQASWGGPLWWPAGVAAASLPAFSALGFAIGTFLPSRYTAPLAAAAAFFILALSTELIHGSQSYWQVSPLVTGPWDLGSQAGVATFYPFLPDLFHRSAGEPAKFHGARSSERRRRVPTLEFL